MSGFQSPLNELSTYYPDNRYEFSDRTQRQLFPVPYALWVSCSEFSSDEETKELYIACMVFHRSMFH